MKRGNPVGSVLVILIVVLLALGGLGLGVGTARAAAGAITRTQSGLVASDSLTTGHTTMWTFGGDAASQPGAKYSYSEDSQGLHIGVQPAASGTWSGYYAVSPPTTAGLFHATVTLAYTSVKDNGFNTGIYVQTANTDFIDYVGCLGTVVPQGYRWVVVQAYGVVVGSQAINTLYQSPLNTMPLTQDCTIITNGNNYLRVYLGGSLVVDRTNMTLNMPEPERVYLESQSSTASAFLTGTYSNYYATSNETVAVTNAPSGGAAEIVDGTNRVIASAPVGSTGVATMHIGNLAMPLNDLVEVFDSGAKLVATTGAAATIWGGDSYTVSVPITTSTTSTSTSITTATPITITNTQSASGSASLPSFQVTLPKFNAGTGTNRLLLVGISANGAPVSSVTFGSASLAPAIVSNYNNDAEIWYLLNPIGTGDVIVTMAGPTSVVVGADAFTGVDLAAPFPTTAMNHNAVPGSPSIMLTTKYANSWVVDMPSIYGGVTLGSPTCNPQWDANVPNAISGASSSSTTTATRSVTCGWTASGSGDMWDDVAVELKGSTAVTTTTTTTTSVPNGITVSAHRIPASYWDPCFATQCTNPYASCNTACTGPGATMYFQVYDSSGKLVAGGYADENGFTFTGLNPNATYYVYPTDCSFCHVSLHDVVFQHWGDGSTVRPLAASVGTSLDAWYSCTNGCAGGP